MYFHTGYTETILFKQWSTTSISLFIGSCLLVFLTAIVNEGIQVIISSSENRQQSRSVTKQVECGNGESERINPKSSISSARIETIRKSRILNADYILRTIFYTVQLILTFLLMLIAMTFNVYLFLAVILGMGVGHLLFAWNRSIPIIERNEQDTAL